MKVHDIHEVENDYNKYAIYFIIYTLLVHFLYTLKIVHRPYIQCDLWYTLWYGQTLTWDSIKGRENSEKNNYHPCEPQTINLHIKKYTSKMIFTFPSYTSFPLSCLYFDTVHFIIPNNWLIFFPKSAGIVVSITLYKWDR